MPLPSKPILIPIPHLRSPRRLLAVAALAATLGAGAQTIPPAQPPQAPQAPQPPQAQQTPPTGFNRNLIVLDPAHGGPNIGTQISDHLLEKDVTLAMAVRLRALLAARGFTVVLTRGNDTALSTDQRAELANRTHAVACLVLHATASGTGVHIDTALPAAAPTTPGAPLRWDDAQAAYLTQSQRLADQIGAAMNRSQVPLVSGHAALRPLDNLMCPAVSIELAPLALDGSDPIPVTNPSYQQHVDAAIAGALIFWRNQAQPPAIPAPHTTAPTTPTTAGGPQ
jgi:N-acetylmuramoyl-L-alanine amidase